MPKPWLPQLSNCEVGGVVLAVVCVWSRVFGISRRSHSLKSPVLRRVGDGAVRVRICERCGWSETLVSGWELALSSAWRAVQPHGWAGCTSFEQRVAGPRHARGSSHATGSNGLTVPRPLLAAR